jgi:hypothetical protein
MVESLDVAGEGQDERIARHGQLGLDVHGRPSSTAMTESAIASMESPG